MTGKGERSGWEEPSRRGDWAARGKTWAQTGTSQLTDKLKAQRLGQTCRWRGLEGHRQVAADTEPKSKVED